MAFIFGDRVKEVSTTSGTGAMTLGGASLGFQTFVSTIGLTNETFYGIVHETDGTWELGRGTVGASTLSRDTILSSSNSNLIVTFAAGNKTVFSTDPAAFYTAALDGTSHAAIDHTSAGPLSKPLLDATDHLSIDHTSGSMTTPLLSVTNHTALDHTSAGPLAKPLLDAIDHLSIDHTSGSMAKPLLDATLSTHGQIDHTDAAFVQEPLMSISDHNALDHHAITATNVGEDNPAQVSAPEKATGTESGLRSFSPNDVKDMAATFGSGSGKLVQMVFATPVTSVVTCSQVVPRDNTIPQLTEGDGVQFATITPVGATNTLVFDFQASGTGAGADCNPVAFLVQGVGPDALAVSLNQNVGNSATADEANITLRHYMTVPAAGSPLTFNIMIGKRTGTSNFHVNGDSTGTQLFNGTSVATFSISEIAT